MWGAGGCTCNAVGLRRYWTSVMRLTSASPEGCTQYRFDNVGCAHTHTHTHMHKPTRIKSNKERCCAMHNMSRHVPMDTQADCCDNNNSNEMCYRERQAKRASVRKSKNQRTRPGPCLCVILPAECMCPHRHTMRTANKNRASKAQKENSSGAAGQP
jgi:hypothetical protein